ncbi:MAG: YfiR family protein [Planctomycetes bacterium]|nr:YfiR family protein [Planctomycetota bacterium]
MSRTFPIARNLLIAALAFSGAGLPGVGAQETPKVDWDTAAANTLVLLLKDGHLQPPKLEEKKELTIAVLGDDRFGKAVAALIEGKKTPAPHAVPMRAVPIAEKDIVDQKDRWADCDVIVIATDSDRAWTQVLAILAGKQGLLVGRRPGFVAAGGHVQLWLSDRKSPRFELDLVAIRELGFKVSSLASRHSKQRPEQDQ